MSFDDIPKELQRKPQWVCWGKDKVPMNPNARTVGSPTNPKTWGSFDEAVEAAPFFNGIGFCFTKDDLFVGIDFDKCIKAISEEAKEEACLQKNARMSINKQGNPKMRRKPLFPRMRMPIRK